jgi:hypothetical protein
MNPWGPLDWLESKTDRLQGRRILLACVASEERCVVVPMRLMSDVVNELHLFSVADPKSRFSDRIAANGEKNRKILVEANVIADAEVPAYPLFAFDDEINAIFMNALGDVAAEERVELWIDITCMPKRFFFLFVKLALRSRHVDSLYVTYAQPAPGLYTSAHLAEDPEIPEPLPGFGPSVRDPDKLIVAVGFEPLGLSQLLGEYRDRNRELLYLLPFPPGQPYSRRVWETVLNIGWPGEHRIRRVPALDMFGTIRALLSATASNDDKRISAVLAPYGPKPTSLAMCVYASYFGSACYYTQPRVYHPDYSMGRGSAWAYCLRLSGCDTFPES